MPLLQQGNGPLPPSLRKSLGLDRLGVNTLKVSHRNKPMRLDLPQGASKLARPEFSFFVSRNAGRIGGRVDVAQAWRGWRENDRPTLGGRSGSAIPSHRAGGAI